ncbi:hypothetical protein ACH6CV_17755 [Bacillota bacterium Meth-B3]
MEDGIGAKLEARKLSVPLCGTGRSTIDLRLILSKGEGDAVLESARFTDAKTAACFGLEVVDYRTLTIARDPDAAITGSVYTSAIELTLRERQDRSAAPGGRAGLEAVGGGDGRAAVERDGDRRQGQSQGRSDRAICHHVSYPVPRVWVPDTAARGLGLGSSPKPRRGHSPDPSTLTRAAAALFALTPSTSA